MLARTVCVVGLSEPQKRADMAAVNHRCGPVDPSCGVQPSQQLPMQPLPHPSSLPCGEPPVCGRWGAAHLRRKMPPGDPSEKNEHDRVETHTVIDTRTAATWIRRMIREQRLHRLPQLVPHPPHRASPPPPPPPPPPHPPTRARHGHLLTGLCHPMRFVHQHPNPPPRGIETASYWRTGSSNPPPPGGEMQ